VITVNAGEVCLAVVLNEPWYNIRIQLASICLPSELKF
jgi:hypothetical protein